MIGAIVTFVTNIVVGITSNETDNLLHSLLDVQNEQLTLLRRLDRNVQDLLEGPYYTASITLRDATDPWRTSEERLEFLKHARSLLNQAVGQFKSDHFMKSLAAASLATVWVLTGSSPDARRWLGIAHDEAEAALSAALERESAWRRARGVAYDYKQLGKWLVTLGGHKMAEAKDISQSRLVPIAQWAAAMREILRKTESASLPRLRIVNVDMKYFESSASLGSFFTPYKSVVYEE